MKFWLSWIAFAVAVALLALVSLNASWFVAAPGGEARLIARHGIAQLVDAKSAAAGGCAASNIEPPVHDFVANTVRSMQSAWGMGADMVEIDVQPTADGKLAVFGDVRLDCRTNGKGEVRERTLAGLKALDAGYSYTADGGRTFPLRGVHGNVIPSAAEALKALPITSILFNFASDDPAAADRLVEELKAAGRDVARRGDAFVGPPAPIARIRRTYPRAWAWTTEDAERCTGDYLGHGWLTIVPESCRNGTLIVPLDRQWLYAGWPNRLLARMAKAGAHVVITASYRGGEPRGLTLPEQLGKVPSSFNGYLLVDDMWTVGPAVHPERDFRTREQQDAADALARRR